VLGAVGRPARSNSTLADVQVAGKTFFDLFDFVSSNVLMPLGGIFLCLFGLGMGIRADEDGADQWRRAGAGDPQAPCSSSSATCRRC
jgi:SNF family Na+-dependent transporter